MNFPVIYGCLMRTQIRLIQNKFQSSKSIKTVKFCLWKTVRFFIYYFLVTDLKQKEFLDLSSVLGLVSSPQDLFTYNLVVSTKMFIDCSFIFNKRNQLFILILNAILIINIILRQTRKQMIMHTHIFHQLGHEEDNHHHETYH